MLKYTELKKIIYPAILVVFVVVYLIVFIYTTGFISKAMNKSLSSDEQLLQSHLVKLDLVNFYLVAKKLGLDSSIDVRTIINN